MNERSSPRHSIRSKALALFLLIGVVLPALAAFFLLPRYGIAVRVGEERNQQLTLSRIREQLDQTVSGSKRELLLLANAVAQASSFVGEEAPLANALLESALASSELLDVVRLTIPSASISTVIAKAGADATSVPALDPSLMREADERGWAYGSLSSGKASLVVAVPGKGGVPSYVSAVHHVDQLRHHLARTVELSRLTSATVVVTTHEGIVLASFSDVKEASPKFGSDALRLPVFADTPPMDSMDITREFVAGGEKMVASVGTAPALGWHIAVWRPLDIALREYTRAKNTALGWGVALLVIAFALAVWSSFTLTQPIFFVAEQAARIGQRKWSELKPELTRKDELGQLSHSISNMAVDLRQSEEEIKTQVRYRTNLSRFLSQPVVDDVLSGKNALTLGGTHESVTVLFADMVAFSRAAETNPPEKIVGLLNELFSVLTEVVFRHEGTVDKFIGDCMMAVWGAPLPQEDHALKAVRAARDMMRFLDAAAEDWFQEYQVEVRLAIGINSGLAIVGNIGSSKRMEYTVVGDVVNVAARLETIAAANQVLLSQHTHALVKGEFSTRHLGQRTLSGRSASIGVHELEFI